MEFAVFAKKRTTQEGKPFYSYLATLTRKDGAQQTVTVKFRDECGQPKPDKCPMNISVDRKSANLTKREYTNSDTGEVRTSYTLWVSEWKQSGEYVDHSLDEYI